MVVSGTATVQFRNSKKKNVISRNFVNYSEDSPSIECKRMTDPNTRMLSLERTPQSGLGNLPPAWREFIRFCDQMKHGEIERLSIQDGVPVLAEITKKKVKFS